MHDIREFYSTTANFQSAKVYLFLSSFCPHFQNFQFIDNDTNFLKTVFEKLFQLEVYNLLNVGFTIFT